MVSRFARWFEEHPLHGDAALAAALLLLFALPADLSADTGAAADLAFSTALLACLPFRRVAPVPAFAAVVVLCLAQLALLDHIVAGDVAVLIALYSVVAYGPGRVAGVAATACTVAGAVLAAARWDAQTEQASTFDVAFSTAASVLLAASLGAWRRTRRNQLAALEARSAALERARIARELHDIVAHSLSVQGDPRPLEPAADVALPPPADRRLGGCPPAAHPRHRGRDAGPDRARLRDGPVMHDRGGERRSRRRGEIVPE